MAAKYKHLEHQSVEYNLGWSVLVFESKKCAHIYDKNDMTCKNVQKMKE